MTAQERIGDWWRRRGRRRTIALAIVLAIALGLFALALLLRLPDLDAYLNLDAAHGWHGRTRNFWRAVDKANWPKTYQKNHPGVTLMWLAGPFIENGPGFTSKLTPEHVRAGALPIALIGSLLASVTYLLWRRLMGFGHRHAALIAGLLIATEPLLVAHSRVMHLDMLMTALLWTAVLSSSIAIRRGRLGYSVLGGALLGLAVLTKVTAGAVAVGVAGWYAIACIRTRGRRLRYALGLVITTTVALVVAYAAWPALWDDPMKIIDKVLEEGRSVVDKGHRMFFWGDEEKDPGPLFYAVVLMYRTSPELLLLAIPGAAWIVRRRRRLGTTIEVRRRSALALTGAGIVCAYALLALVLALGAKKQDRYLVPLYPALCVASAYGAVVVARALARLTQRWLPRRVPATAWLLALAAVLAGARSARIAATFPYPTTWAATWPPRPVEEALQLGWCEGMRETGEWIRADAGPDRRPKVWSGIHHCLMPYLKHERVKEMRDAEYVIFYISFRQRNWWKGNRKKYAKTLLHEVELAGRVYVQIFSGPKFPKSSPTPTP